MESKLDKLLIRIDPQNNYDDISSCVDSALNSFKVDNAIITTLNEYESLLAGFFRHVENYILKIPNFKSPDIGIDLGRCISILNKEYGPSGEKAAFEIVRTGKEGGLHSVLRAIARNMLEEYTGNEVAARINEYWNSLSISEKLTATEEYIAKYGHLIPSEVMEGNAARIKMNFPRVLKEHHHLIKRLRRIGNT